jgi:hypothetical protein
VDMLLNLVVPVSSSNKQEPLIPALQNWTED